MPPTMAWISPELSVYTTANPSSNNLSILSSTEQMRDSFPAPLWRYEYPTRRCCETHSGEDPGETIPQSAYPKRSSFPIGDWCTRQQNRRGTVFLCAA